MSAARKGKIAPQGLPSEDAIVEFVAAAPGRVGKREIARAFGIRDSQLKSELKRLIRKMAEEGRLEMRARRVADAQDLPPVAVIEVLRVDEDGELVAQPASWDAENQGPAPRIVIIAERVTARREDKQPPGAGERVLARLSRSDGTGFDYEARIIRRLTRQTNLILGVLRPVSSGGFRLQPVDRRARGDYVVQPGNAGTARASDLVSAEISRDRGRGLIEARVVERLGSMDDQRNISRIAIHQHGIPDRFPAEVMAEAETLANFKARGANDLTRLPLVTIDPVDARDHDDAVHAAPDDDPANPGGFVVTVAIADVACYVRAGTALDREARVRGNSVYFPDRVVPMLPEKISNDMCSLKKGEIRPALACRMVFDVRGDKRDHRFVRVAMRSAARLTYQQAQAAIDGAPDDVTGPILETVLKPLWSAHDALMSARRRRQPLELDLPERKIVLDAHGLIERVVTPERLDAHKLIEEMMIQANVAAAETLEEKTSPLIYRVHEAPARDKVAALADFLATVGISLPRGQVLSPAHFNRILAQVVGRDDEQLINEVVLRTQAQAVYSPDNRGHFGLNLRRYAHFTSPIRRYADLIVHRALVAALGLGRDGLSAADIGQLHETAEIISGAERRAMAAERDTVDRLIAAHLKTATGALFAARIAGVTTAGLFVRLAETGADGFIPMRTLPGRFVHDEVRHALVGTLSGETFQLGDRVEVRLVEVTPIAGGLRFEMVSEGRDGAPPVRRRFHAKPPLRRGRRR